MVLQVSQKLELRIPGWTLGARVLFFVSVMSLVPFGSRMSISAGAPMVSQPCLVVNQRFPPSKSSSTLRRIRKSVWASQNKDDESNDPKIVEGLRKALREGGSRPIQASDSLREIQENNPIIIQIAFVVVGLLLVASFVFKI
mmetsp:Transcript_2232/g.3220  ORF Transcript_2232/g.3220 Transcript_2232/m.3220 type:complete len:142 (+) Transcript_2232:129-554(+)